MESKKPSFLRHSGWLHSNMVDRPICIVGCGGIGSNVAMIAARMGFKEFILWDADIVEDYNLANQQFFPRHIGKPKVEALAELLQSFNPDIKVQTHNIFFNTSAHAENVSGFLVIATDSMKSRKDIYDTFQFNNNISMVVEARLGFEHGEIHLIDPLKLDDCNRWYEKLVDDNLIPEGPCNQRLCSTLVTTMSALMVQYICAYLVAKSNNNPFTYSYGTLMVMKNNQVLVRQHTNKEK